MEKKVAQPKTLRVRIQKMGGFLSAMVMPNIGVFIAWGLLAAFFIPTGWTPNEHLNELVGPILTYLLPILIGYVGGYNVYGKRGGAIGALSTMGVVIGADITMLIGGMIMGPIGALIIKKVDSLFKGKVKPGLEMLVDNFSLGIVGFIIAILGFLIVEPIFGVILAFLSAGVNWLTDRNLIPLTSIFVQPAQVLFLNNAINHGIMVPLGLQQVADTGKSILFLVEANGGTWTGLLLAFAFFGKGISKKSAPASTLIMFLGGIGEVAFPYALIKPVTILGPMLGNMASLAIAQLFNGGTVGAVSPGSFLALLMMTPKGAFVVNITCYVVATLVSFLVVAFFLKLDKTPEEAVSLDTVQSTTSVDSVLYTAPFTATGTKIERVIIACDAGMGSSAMGASMLRSKAKKANLHEVTVENVSVDNIPNDVDLIITSENLEERVKSLFPDKSVPILTIKNFLNNEEYDQFIQFIKESYD
ncbi:PTS mannitol transporter subunit IICB [Vagococcus acidifermentans]|uniref:PTS system mannitol-specific EIICB component n=1 Tax=Vagococcus acidifermentans TaxID=564710 RepID=A0A430ARK7_9ENTE|nr:PTS mannitol transporter subunit IICB [Vagococcus acidifermentans]RSU10688.1 PTS mannitol transporter subunit IIBC [Vagococcus acidifermentans]